MDSETVVDGAGGVLALLQSRKGFCAIVLLLILGAGVGIGWNKYRQDRRLQWKLSTWNQQQIYHIVKRDGKAEAEPQPDFWWKD